MSFYGGSGGGYATATMGRMATPRTMSPMGRMASLRTMTPVGSAGYGGYASYADMCRMNGFNYESPATYGGGFGGKSVYGISDQTPVVSPRTMMPVGSMATMQTMAAMGTRAISDTTRIIGPRAMTPVGSMANMRTMAPMGTSTRAGYGGYASYPDMHGGGYDLTPIGGYSGVSMPSYGRYGGYSMSVPSYGVGGYSGYGGYGGGMAYSGYAPTGAYPYPLNEQKRRTDEGCCGLE